MTSYFPSLSLFSLSLSLSLTLSLPPLSLPPSLSFLLVSLSLKFGRKKKKFRGKVSSSSEAVKPKENKEKGDNGFPSFSDLGIPSSTTHFDVSLLLACSYTCVYMNCVLVVDTTTSTYMYVLVYIVLGGTVTLCIEYLICVNELP